MRCWGDEKYQMQQLPPAAAKDVRAVSAGYHFTLAQPEGGRVACWGANDLGQCDLPPSVARSRSTLTLLAAGSAHGCASNVGTRLLCWGANAEGQADPDPALQPFYTALSAGVGHSCAINSMFTLKCWGSDSHGQVSLKGAATPGASVKGVSAGSRHTCYILEYMKSYAHNSLHCEGSNAYAESEVPNSFAINISTILAGYLHTCAIDLMGWLECWGADHLWDVGRVDQRLYGHKIWHLALGAQHNCSYFNSKGSHNLVCWGSNEDNQLNIPNFDSN